MITVNNKEYRNLVEQVGYLTNRVDEHYERDRVLADYGIRVVGSIDSVDQLPNPVDYNGLYGDAYTVGTGAPYDFYIFTRPLQGETENRWLDLGQLAIQGPQGAIGPEGPVGPQGESTQWYVGQGTPYIEANKNSLYFDTTTANIYQKQVGQWVIVANIKGNNGAQGPQGPKGDTGEQGPQGIQGENGVPGDAVNIVGILTSALMLPDPDTVARDSAYVIEDGTGQWLYFITGLGTTESPLIWDKVAFENGTTVLVDGNPVQTFDADNYVKKIIGNSGLSVVPIINGDKTQTYAYIQNNKAQSYSNYIPRYQSAAYDIEGQTVNGVLITKDPTKDFHCANKKYVDEQVQAAKDASVPITTIADRAYVTDGLGNTTTRTISTSPNQGAVVIYYTNGVIRTGTPTADSHATTKKYVDDSIATAQAEHQKVILQYVTGGTAIADASNLLNQNPDSRIVLEAAPFENAGATYGIGTTNSASTVYNKIVINNITTLGVPASVYGYKADGTVVKLTITSSTRFYAQTQTNTVTTTITKISSASIL